MADLRITPENNGVRYGLLTAAGMVLYFLVAGLLGLTGRVELSYLNVVILAVGICLAIARYRRYRHDRMPYLHGFGTGIITAIVASVAFGFFFLAYAVLNPGLVEQLRTTDLFGADLSITICFLAILLQGAMSGVIISLVAMQYFKSPDHMPMQGVE
ncbi:DUF4199 domain-containing protein [Hymenobacter sp. J193]|uniref:DUF4199 domain-containing protein n=1 Tax=Hymenobacter sp. J193 TaxID=2898429 RepID=UPI0021514CCE|nr:DUF4199 domain-containing protein [Hymenobacter sp. J193]MCR5886201.1 DUF4199 domain-containing protein [Hymenobacter sp. J193]MCR5890226.1 DUF4199 domain-containing protein [Hymenobacter sp. J193]